MPEYEQDIVLPIVGSDEGYMAKIHATSEPAYDNADQPAPNIKLAGHNAITQDMADAVPVFARSGNRCIIGSMFLQESALNNQPFILVDRRKGRDYVIIKCDNANTAGAYIGSSFDSLQNVISNGVGGFLITTTSTPLTIPTEGTIWAVGAGGNGVNDIIEFIEIISLPDDTFDT